MGEVHEECRGSLVRVLAVVLLVLASVTIGASTAWAAASSRVPKSCQNSLFDADDFVSEWQLLVGPIDATWDRDELGVPSNLGMLGYQIDADARGEEPSYETEQLANQIDRVGTAINEFLDNEFDRCIERLKTVNAKPVGVCKQAIGAAAAMITERYPAFIDFNDDRSPTGAYGEYLSARAGGGAGLEQFDAVLSAIEDLHVLASDFEDLYLECDF